MWRTGTEYQMLEWQRAVFTIQTIIHTMADSMKTGGAERGVQRLALLEQSIFKLIWVQCFMFVLWPHKDTRKKVSEPPPTKFTCPQTVQTGTFTKKKVLKRFGKSNAVMIRFGVRYSNWRPYSVLVIGLLKYMSIEICHGSYSFDCLLKAIITVISKWVYRSP